MNNCQVEDFYMIVAFFKLLLPCMYSLLPCLILGLWTRLQGKGKILYIMVIYIILIEEVKMNKLVSFILIKSFIVSLSVGRMLFCFLVRQLGLNLNLMDDYCVHCWELLSYG